MKHRRWNLKLFELSLGWLQKGFDKGCRASLQVVPRIQRYFEALGFPGKITPRESDPSELRKCLESSVTECFDLFEVYSCFGGYWAFWGRVPARLCPQHHSITEPTGTHTRASHHDLRITILGP